jgi:hypothetical protein
MSLETLTEEELDIVQQCLKASVEGPFFPEQEFHTIFGVWRGEAKEVLESWPNVNEEDKIVSLVINNAMNNLLGYPHRCEGVWDEHISVPREEVARVYGKWRGGRGITYGGHLK